MKVEVKQRLSLPPRYAYRQWPWATELVGVARQIEYLTTQLSGVDHYGGTPGFSAVDLYCPTLSVALGAKREFLQRAQQMVNTLHTVAPTLLLMTFSKRRKQRPSDSSVINFYFEGAPPDGFRNNLSLMLPLLFGSSVRLGIYTNTVCNTVYNYSLPLVCGNGNNALFSTIQPYRLQSTRFPISSSHPLGSGADKLIQHSTIISGYQLPPWITRERGVSKTFSIPTPAIASKGLILVSYTKIAWNQAIANDDMCRYTASLVLCPTTPLVFVEGKIKRDLSTTIKASVLGE